MITLITGTPGAGKTAYAVAELFALQAQANRPLFVLGIPDLKLDHSPVPPLDQWAVVQASAIDASFQEANFTFPDGALVVVDEAQQVFRPRANGAAVPPYVAAFERHRHSGLDFWLITQHPTLLDANVRKLIGKHIHIRSSWSGRQLFERPEPFDPGSRTELNLAATRPYKLPKKAFELYKSASLHVKQSRRIPITVYALFILLALMIAIGVFSYQRFTSDKEALQQYQQKVIQPSPSSISPSVPSEKVVTPKSPYNPDLLSPKYANIPESAPLYDEMRTPDKMPIISGCIQKVSTCFCYTQQRTRISMTFDQCREWIKDKPFRPWSSSGSYAVVIRSEDRLAGDGAAGSR